MGALANAHLDGHGLKVTQFIYATVKFALCYRYANPRSPSLPRTQIVKLKFHFSASSFFYNTKRQTLGASAPRGHLHQPVPVFLQDYSRASWSKMAYLCRLEDFRKYPMSYYCQKEC